MKVQDKDFISFQKHFTKYQKLFGLTGYKVYFEYKPLVDRFAEIETNQSGMVAVVRLNSQLPDCDKPHKQVAGSAKHEALHLLLNRLQYLAMNRYITEDELEQAVEETVVRLEGVIS